MFFAPLCYEKFLPLPAATFCLTGRKNAAKKDPVDSYSTRGNPINQGITPIFICRKNE
jgi:hypothetical protein